MFEGGFTHFVYQVLSVELHQWKSALSAFNAEVYMEERSKTLSVHVCTASQGKKKVEFSLIKTN